MDRVRVTFKASPANFLQVCAQKFVCIEQICTKIYKWKILHRTNIYKYFQMGRKSTRIEQMDFTSFFRTPALPNGGSGSILLFTIGNNTVVFPAEQSSSCFCLFHLPSHRLQQAPQKLSVKTIRTTNQTFAVLYFFFLSKSRNIVPPRHESANTKNQMKMNLIASSQILLERTTQHLARIW